MYINYTYALYNISISKTMQRDFTDQEQARRGKLKNLVDNNQDPYLIQKFERNFNSQTFKDTFEKFSHDELHVSTEKVLIAGRIIALRQTFGVIKDFYGKTQFYINKKTIDPDT
jgi:lysyl-tRNA synthetase class 2